jgi:hypothetical protein
MSRAFAVVAASILTARLCGAQLVRGLVTERTSGTPVAGALISLERAPPTQPGPVARVLTNERGEFAVSPRAAGQYVLTAKRIGVQRFVSRPFEIASGETRRMDIVLDPVSTIMPTVEVAGATACRSRSQDAGRIASLWDEARTALLATQTAVYDRDAQASVFRYTRDLEPRALQVINETRAESRGPLTQHFVSASGDSLSRRGYWQDLGGDTVVYHAPDANVLLSAAFLIDHCFSLAAAEKKRPGMIGLGFEPVPRRPVPEIRGAMWMDPETFQLRVVEYRYTRLPRSQSDTRIGGEVWFAALPNGAWIVRRWHIRMPQFADYAPVEPVVRDAHGVNVTQRQTAGLGVPRRTSQVHRVLEEGGNVFVDHVHFYKTPADISGVVADSAGRPLPSARIALGGSPFETTSDGEGRFAFDSLPSGAYTLLVRHRAYDELGVFAADTSVSVNEGDRLSLTLRTKVASQILAQMCEFAPPPSASNPGTLRLLFRHRETGLPLAAVPVNLYWLGRPVVDLGQLRVKFEGEKPDGIQGLTDKEGAFNFCGVPSGIPLFIRPLLPTLQIGPTVAQCEVRKGEVSIRVVRTAVPDVAVSPHVTADTLMSLAFCETPKSPNDSMPRELFVERAR